MQTVQAKFTYHTQTLPMTLQSDNIENINFLVHLVVLINDSAEQQSQPQS